MMKMKSVKLHSIDRREQSQNKYTTLPLRLKAEQNKIPKQTTLPPCKARFTATKTTNPPTNKQINKNKISIPRDLCFDHQKAHSNQGKEIYTCV